MPFNLEPNAAVATIPRWAGPAELGSEHHRTADICAGVGPHSALVSFLRACAGGTSPLGCAGRGEWITHPRPVTLCFHMADTAYLVELKSDSAERQEVAIRTA